MDYYLTRGMDKFKQAVSMYLVGIRGPSYVEERCRSCKSMWRRSYQKLIIRRTDPWRAVRNGERPWVEKNDNLEKEQSWVLQSSKRDRCTGASQGNEDGAAEGGAGATPSKYFSEVILILGNTITTSCSTTSVQSEGDWHHKTSTRKKRQLNRTAQCKNQWNNRCYSHSDTLRMFTTKSAGTKQP